MVNDRPPVVAAASEVKSRRPPALLASLLASLLVDLEAEPAGLALGVDLGLVGPNLAALKRLRGRAGKRRRLAEYVVALLALGALGLAREDLLVGADREQVVAPPAVLDDALLSELGGRRRAKERGREDGGEEVLGRRLGVGGCDRPVLEAVESEVGLLEVVDNRMLERLLEGALDQARDERLREVKEP